MKRTLALIISLLCVVASHSGETIITPDSMYPTDSSGVFTDRPPAEIENSTEAFSTVAYDTGQAVIKEVNASTLQTTTVNTYGELKVSEDMDWQDPAKLDKFYQDNTNTYLNGANNFAEDFRKASKVKFTDKNGNKLDNNAPEQYSDSAIVENFDEESDARSALIFKEELYRDMKAKLVVNTSIQCYITRQLNNSYYCPIPGYGIATYGGGAKDSKDDSMERCNEKCALPTVCLSRKNNDNLTYSDNGEYILPINNLQLPLNPSQVTQEFSFEYYPQDVDDIQDKYFDDELVRSRVTISGLDEYGNPVTIYDRYDYPMKKEGGKISLSIDKKLQRVDLKFYDSYIFDPLFFDNIALHGANPTVMIKNISAGYLSDRRFFCPVTQLENDATKCNGHLEFLDFGGTSFSVCVPDSGNKLESTRSPIDGGYYREASCEAACWETEDCVPTYRHLAYNKDNLPDSMYDLEYGCIESDDNAGCTKDRCKKLFEDDIQPSKEKVWEKDDQVITTVNSGVNVGNTPRPRVDFGGELSSNGADKTNVFIEEMKDNAYRYMIEKESFNVTKDVITKPVPEKSAVDIRVNSVSKQISFSLLYKPDSELVDTSAQIFLYPVIEMSMTYRPIKPVSYKGKLLYPDVDTRIKGKDKVYLLKNEATKSWQPFRRVFYTEYYLPVVADNGETSYKWVPTTSSIRVHDDTYDSASMQYVVYGASYAPPSPLSFVPSSDKVWEQFLRFKNLGNLIVQEGNLFTANSASDGRIYNPSFVDDKTKAYYDGYKVHLVSSVSTPLTFSQITAKLSENTVIYDTKNPRASKVEIEPDSLYADDRVKLYSLGTKDNKTVYMKMEPKTTEESHKGIIFMFTHE